MQNFAALLLWLMVIFLGIGFGAGLYESRIVVPMWAQTPPESWVNTGTRFWAFVTSGPLTLVTIASLLVVWGYAGPSRAWWIAALAAVMVERALTFGYFIPTMISLQGETGMSAATSARLATWSLANHLRHVLSFGAWLLALRALSLLNAQQGA